VVVFGGSGARGAQDDKSDSGLACTSHTINVPL